MAHKTAVITGATSGIGAAYAKEFARRGYDLILTGRRKEKIEAQAEGIREKYGVNADVVLAELSEGEGIQKVLSAMRGKEVDVLVNNAGFGVASFYQDSDLGVMEQLAKVNVLTPMELIRAVLPDMVRRHSGLIINLSSESAFLVIRRNAVYAGVKSFLKVFTESLHLDLFGTGVKVLAVCPGATHTDFHEKMGIEKSRQTNNPFIHWLSPEKIVELSMKDLRKGKVISIPGLHTKTIIRLLSILPRKIYYKAACNAGGKKEGAQ